MGKINICIPGDHNVLNALAAVAVGLELDIDFEYIREGLKGLGGLRRRFEIKDERGGIIFLDDYGHHPTEIVATITTAKECWPDRRLVLIFQPHRYTRTKALWDKFVIAFNQADLLIITPIYGAGEEPIPGVDSRVLYQGIKDHGHRAVNFCPYKEDVISLLLDEVRPGDLVLTLGAGDINLVGTELLKRIKD
jgi:UDP-N-acetylmuramate--alanine ligase